MENNCGIKSFNSFSWKYNFLSLHNNFTIKDIFHWLAHSDIFLGWNSDRLINYLAEIQTD